MDIRRINVIRVCLMRNCLFVLSLNASDENSKNKSLISRLRLRKFKSHIQEFRCIFQRIFWSNTTHCIHDLVRLRNLSWIYQYVRIDIRANGEKNREAISLIYRVCVVMFLCIFSDVRIVEIVIVISDYLLILM